MTEVLQLCTVITAFDPCPRPCLRRSGGAHSAQCSPAEDVSPVTRLARSGRQRPPTDANMSLPRHKSLLCSGNLFHARSIVPVLSSCGVDDDTASPHRPNSFSPTRPAVSSARSSSRRSTWCMTRTVNDILTESRGHRTRSGRESSRTSAPTKNDVGMISSMAPDAIGD